MPLPTGKFNVRHGGVWKGTKALHIRSGGVWHEAKGLFVMKNGEWKALFMDKPPDEVPSNPTLGSLRGRNLKLSWTNTSIKWDIRVAYYFDQPGYDIVVDLPAGSTFHAWNPPAGAVGRTVYASVQYFNDFNYGTPAFSNAVTVLS